MPWPRRFPSIIALAALVIVLAVPTVIGYRRAQNPDRRLRLGQEQARADNLDGAERVAQRLADAGWPEHAALLRAEIAARRNRPLETLAELKQVQSAGHLRRAAAILAAPAFHALDKSHQAEQALQFVLAEEPHNPEAHRWLAVIYFDQGDFVRSMTHLDRLIVLEPANPRPHWMNGRILQDLEDYRSAVRSYREALKRNPDPALAAKIRIDLALCLNNDHDNTGALEALDGISAKDSASASAQLLRAEALVGLGRNAEAAELLDAAIKRYPEVGGLHHLRGGLYLNMGDSKAAAASLERAIALNPGEYRPRYQLALAFEQLGRTKEAAEQRSKADQTKNDLLELSKLNREAMKDPWDAEVRYKLADACERLHMPQLAAMWRKAAKACPKK